jgi:hypothetical protein
VGVLASDGIQYNGRENASEMNGMCRGDEEEKAINIETESRTNSKEKVTVNREQRKKLDQMNKLVTLINPYTNINRQYIVELIIEA